MIQTNRLFSFQAPASIPSVAFAASSAQMKRRSMVASHLSGPSQDVFQAQPRFGMKPSSASKTYLHQCVENEDEFGALTDADVNLNKEELEMRDAKGMTPLLLAASLGNLPAVKILLQHGADIQKKDNDGQGMYHLAAVSAIGDVTRGVLEHLLYHHDSSLEIDDQEKLDINAKDDQGNTPFDTVEQQRGLGLDINPVLRILWNAGGRPAADLAHRPL